jgi:hypothetical protein
MSNLILETEMQILNRNYMNMTNFHEKTNFHINYAATSICVEAKFQTNDSLVP